MMTKLKPCPFCGGEAHLTRKLGQNITYDWFVYCQNCGCKTPYWVKDHVTAIWNRRVRE